MCHDNFLLANHTEHARGKHKNQQIGNHEQVVNVIVCFDLYRIAYNLVCIKCEHFVKGI